MNWLRRLRHRAAHYFGLNKGQVQTWWKGDDLMAGFYCYGCGKTLHSGRTGITANGDLRELHALRERADRS